MDREEAKKMVMMWLKHPTELGTWPQKVVFTSEFTDEDGIQCMIFKYRKKFLSPWLLAIASDSGIFSEMKPYHKETEREDAQDLLDFLKQYWKNQANVEKEREVAAEQAEPFQAHILLKNGAFSFAAFEQALTAEWEVQLKSDEKSDEANASYTADDIRLQCSCQKTPHAQAELMKAAKQNSAWKEAEAVVKSHTAGVHVTVCGGGSSKDRGFLFAKVITTCARMENVVGIHMNEVVYEPKFFLTLEEILKTGKLPVLDLVWIGMANGAQGTSCFTRGMKAFGKPEFEILNAAQSTAELRKMMVNITDYVISNDAFLHHGETIGYTGNTRLSITQSKGVNVKGSSLKITVES